MHEWMACLQQGTLVPGLGLGLDQQNLLLAQPLLGDCLNTHTIQPKQAKTTPNQSPSINTQTISEFQSDQCVWRFEQVLSIQQSFICLFTCIEKLENKQNKSIFMIFEIRGSKILESSLNIIIMYYRIYHGQRTTHLGLVWLKSNFSISYEGKSMSKW